MLKIGIDLGGSKIERVVIDENGRTQLQKRIATPRQYAATIEAIAGLVNDAEISLGFKTTVGVGIPGSLCVTTGLVKNANSTWLNGHAIDVDLSKRLAREVRIGNDANCFTISEAIDGAGAGKNIVLGVIIGTGCGSGIAINGKIHRGINGLGGEWAHNPLPWITADEFNSTHCFCKKHNCIETFISGTGFIADFRAAGGVAEHGSQIMALVDKGHKTAVASFDRYIDRLARSFAHVINFLDPDIIVLGGGMSNVKQIYPRLPAALTHYVAGGKCQTPVVMNDHGCSSGVRGAAWLWKN